MRLDPKKTALLSLDFQKGIIGLVAGAEAAVPQAAKAVALARAKGYLLIHVGLGFEPGHPEVPEGGGTAFAQLKQNKMFVKGSESAEFHPALFKAGDHVVYKQRYGAFSHNGLQMILRANGIEDLVFFGISTSGITLSTLRLAFDLDYRCTVLKDACFDRDEEVHRVLTEKVFAAQARVMTVDEFIAEQGGMA